MIHIRWKTPLKFKNNPLKNCYRVKSIIYFIYKLICMESIVEKPTILIVDDEVEFNVKPLRKILESEGFHVLEANNGFEARKIAREETPDLILLDIMMPGESGYVTCEKLKRNPKTTDIPIIFISANSDSVSKLQGFKLGANDYITKPFDHAEVIARTKVHLKLSLTTKHLLKDQMSKLSLLKQAQQDILIAPQNLPVAKFSVFYKSLHEAGGDFYDVIEFSQDIYGYFCADVSGHDLGATLATSSFKALLPQNTGLLYSPVDSLKMINSVLFNVLSEYRYLTAVYAKINRAKGVVEIANAGHTAIIYQPLDGPIEVLDTKGDILGMHDNISLDLIEFKVHRGDRIYMFTDGIIEFDGEKKITRQDGIERLTEAVDNTVSLKLDEAVNSIINYLFNDISNLDDDILLMGVDI